MKRCFLLLFFSFVAAAQMLAAPSDTLSARLALLAARGEAAELRPLYLRNAATLPPYTRLYCEMALARADRRYGRMVASIDTLLRDYPRRLGTNGRFALVELKAHGLQQLGRYDELAVFCRKELKYYRRKRFERSRLSRLADYERKGQRLAGGSLRARILGLADRDSVFALRALYAAAADSLDAYARWRAGLSLSLAFRRDAAALALSDSLLSVVPDSLDADDFAKVLTARCRLLAHAGRWGELADVAGRYEADARAGALPLAHFRRQGQAWRDVAPSQLTAASEVLPVHVSRDWPLLVSLSLNGGPETPFLFDSGQQHTLVSSALARESALRVLPDTFVLSTPLGLLRVCPALADSLRLGSVTFSRIRLYVTADTARFPAGVSAILGADELVRCGAFRLSGEQLTLMPSARATASAAAPNLRFASAGTPLLRAEAGGEERFFAIDTGNAGSVLSGIVFPRGETDTLAFTFLLDGRELPAGPLVLRDYRLADRDGALGVPFLRGFSEVTLDFRDMRLSVGGPCDYRPLHVFDYVERGDFFALERNAASLAAASAPRDVAFMRLHVAGGKNRPDSVAALAGRLLASAADRTPEAETGERDYLLMYRLHALIQSGLYAEASRLVDGASREGLHSGSVRETLLDLGATCLALAGVSPTRIVAGGAGTAVLSEVGTEDGTPGVELVVNRREMEAALDPGLETTVLTEKAARRLKVRIVHRHAAYPYSVGLIDSLRLGSYVLRDVLCHVYDGKERQMVLGFNVLCHFASVVFSPGRVSLSSVASPAVSGAVPLRFDGRLCAQGLSDGRYVTLTFLPAGRCTLAGRPSSVSVGSLRLPPSMFVPGDFTDEAYHIDGALSLPELVRAAGGVQFDFSRMQLSFPAIAPASVSGDR